MTEAAVVRPLDGRRKRTHLAEIGKRELFVLHYVATGNGAEAARRAGYTKTYARQVARDLLADDGVREAIVRLSRETATKLQIDGPMVLQELAGIAFAPVTPGYISAAEKTKALNLLGVHLKLWEGSRGDRVLNFTILQIDLATL